MTTSRDQPHAAHGKMSRKRPTDRDHADASSASTKARRDVEGRLDQRRRRRGARERLDLPRGERQSCPPRQVSRLSRLSVPIMASDRMDPRPLSPST
jgi:hypothetical protein